MSPKQQHFEYPKLKVESPNLSYVRDEKTGQVHLESKYSYENVRVERQPDGRTIKVS